MSRRRRRSRRPPRRGTSCVAAALTLAGVLAPQVAVANAGTPLLWATAFHLLFGNALIGLGEAWVVSRLLRDVRLADLFSWTIGANYASTIAGLVVLPRLVRWADPLVLGDTPLYHAPRFLLLLLSAALLLSIAVEWPFVGLALRRSCRSPARTLGVTVIAQLASYALLVPAALVVGDASLYTGAEPVTGLGFASRKDAEVRFVSLDGGAEWRIGLDGSPAIRLRGVGRLDREARLAQLGDRARGFGPATDLRSEGDRPWRVTTGFWPGEGLRARSLRTGVSATVALELPGLAWSARYATVLPGEQVVYQLGHQIVLLDLATRKIALVAPGQEPIVTLSR